MKCPQCRAPSEVKETRTLRNGQLRRTRLCFNLHKFRTYEVLESDRASPTRTPEPTPA